MAKRVVDVLVEEEVIQAPDSVGKVAAARAKARLQNLSMTVICGGSRFGEGNEMGEEPSYFCECFKREKQV